MFDAIVPMGLTFGMVGSFVFYLLLII